MSLPDPQAQVGGVAPHQTDDPLVVLLYLLIRDHLSAGVFEKLIAELGDGRPFSLTNPYIGQYAENIAERLRLEGPAVKVAALFTDEEGAAIQDCISIAARMGSSYEMHDGIEVGTAVDVATRALERLPKSHRKRRW